MSEFMQRRLPAIARDRATRRGALTLAIAVAVSAMVALASTAWRSAQTRAQLDAAAERLDHLTEGAPADDESRTAIAWGYAERLRLGLESPFRLVEGAARDPRLTSDEQHTVALALFAHITRGESHVVDAAAFDGIGPRHAGTAMPGEWHLELIERAIASASDPRAAELGVRFAYALASAERLVDAAATVLAAEAAALVADREIARREANAIIRSARRNPIDEVRSRRAGREFYVERPMLLAPGPSMERAAVDVGALLLDSLRSARWVGVRAGSPVPDDSIGLLLAPQLYGAGRSTPPSAALAVTIQRYVPQVRSQIPRIDAAAFGRAHNGEMLAAAVHGDDFTRSQRRIIGRLLMTAAVAMRSSAQEPVWFAGDSAPTAREAATQLGVAEVTFDQDVPAAWRPYFLRTITDGVRDLRRVLPGLTMDAMLVRFRMSAPADSALAMHDPRTRTLHLPVHTAAGTLTHELAHDLDRQSALRQGHAGYRSDFVTRSGAQGGGGGSAVTGRLAASLRAIAEDLSELPGTPRARVERPAEIFATRVDWFVAQALAAHGVSSGFLSAVQDELLTGHVVHPERLRSGGRSVSLVAALEEMTTLSPLAAWEAAPSVQTLLRWSLAGPVDGRVAAEILRGQTQPWAADGLIDEGACDDDETGRVRLIRLAAESRARGWLRQRAQWMKSGDRASWARSILGEGPWATGLAESRVAALRDHMLVELAASDLLPTGLGAYASPLAIRARCA
ncbi:MAG: hypothetical protein WD801_11920 [Gemmatimonadaceae bacterium]